VCVRKEVNGKERSQSSQMHSWVTPQLTPTVKMVKAISATLGLSGAVVVL